VIIFKAKLTSVTRFAFGQVYTALRPGSFLIPCRAFCFVLRPPTEVLSAGMGAQITNSHMKSVLLYFFLMMFFQNVSAQISGKLTGKDGRPIPFANAILLKTTDSTFFQGFVSDEWGRFQIEKATPGNYRLRFTSLGFKTFETNPFSIVTGQAETDLGVFRMDEETNQLAAVEIRAEKPLYQQMSEGMTIHVENSVMSKGSSVMEILERSPGVVVDRRNNSLTLNGKNGVMIMLNGKLIRVPMDQLTTMLNAMNANDIEKIELLTTPPSRYDAEGSAGMINIVLKKNKKPGTTGSASLTTGYGWGEKVTGSANAGHSSEKFDLYGSYSLSHDRSYSNFNAQGTEIVPILGGATSFLFWNETKPIRNNHNLMLVLDAKINTGLKIGGSLNYNNSNSKTNVINRAEYTLGEDSLMLFNGEINGRNRWNSLISSFYGEKKLNRDGKINFDIDYLAYKIKNPTHVQSAFVDEKGNEAGDQPGSKFPTQQNGISDTDIRVGVIRTDYSRKLNKKISIETGAKVTLTSSSSVSGLQSTKTGVRPETENNVRMKEGIVAGYLSFNAQLRSAVSVSAGARYEYSQTRIRDGRSGEITADRKLGVLFPSLSISKKLNENAELQLSFTKRISRPAYNDLTSFVSYNDPISFFTGNPLLKPTITNNLKVGYTYRSYSFSLLASRDDHPIVQGQIVPGAGGDYVFISPQNVAFQNNITFETSLPFKVTAWWNMNYGFVGGYRHYRLDYLPSPAEKTYFGYAVNFSQTIKLPSNFFVEISGFYNSPSYAGNASIKGFGALNAGIKKDLQKNRGTFQLSVTDVLRTMNIQSFIGKFTTDAFNTKAQISYNTESRHFPLIKLTYSRPFKSGFNESEKHGNGSKDERERVR
jgi:outer membrane receptor protein involved in Fe transport